MKKEPKEMGESKKIESYELDSAAECLMRAKEIKDDSSMMKALKDHAKKKWKVLAELESDDKDDMEVSSIDDIKKKSQKKFVKEY